MVEANKHQTNGGHKKPAHFASPQADGQGAGEPSVASPTAPSPDDDYAAPASLDDVDGAHSGAQGMLPSAARREASAPQGKVEARLKTIGAELEPTRTRTAPSAHLQGSDAAHGSEASEELIRHKHKKKRFPLAAKVLIVLVAVLAGVGVALAAYVNSVDEAMKLEEEEAADLKEALSDSNEADEEQAEEEDNAFYTLIIGSDARSEGEVSRSDVIMLARVDTQNAQVTLISIPRDTMIYDRSGNVEKINAEYNYGPSSTVKAVSEYAGVSISHYVEVDFDGLMNVVDALGGVWVNIPEDINAGNGGLSFSAGEQLLNGEQALAYARERYNVSGGDFGRAQAQRQIVEAIIKQVLAASPVEIPGLVRTLAESVKTDLKVADIATYALEMAGADADLTLYSAAAPSYSLNQDGVSYVATMYAEWQDMMRRVDAGLDPNDTDAAIPEPQASSTELGAASNAAGPADYEALVESAGLTTDDVASLE